MKRIRRSWGARVAVEGDSMLPAMRPGDWLLVDPDAYAARSPASGELVLLADPREASRLLVKRVVRATDDGRLIVAGDNAERSTDSRTFGPVETADILGRPWFRYWPMRSIGRVA